MKLSTLAIIISTATADIKVFRHDDTSSVIDSTPGCYGIEPTITDLIGVEGQKLEFYNDYNCKGRKVEEATCDKVFSHPIHAVSVKVSHSSHDSHTSHTSHNSHSNHDNQDNQLEAEDKDEGINDGVHNIWREKDGLNISEDEEIDLGELEDSEYSKDNSDLEREHDRYINNEDIDLDEFKEFEIPEEEYDSYRELYQQYNPEDIDLGELEAYDVSEEEYATLKIPNQYHDSEDVIRPAVPEYLIYPGCNPSKYIYHGC